MQKDLQVFLRQLKQEGKDKNIPNISFFSATLLRFFGSITNARSIFEIGCANGFSTIFLAEIVRRNGGAVLTCDISKPSFEEAQKNLRKANLASFVKFRFGDALKILKPTEKFDFIFIDGQKDQTHKFFLLAKQHLTKTGLIIIDDTKLFPKKMHDFYLLRQTEKHFLFFDIPVEDRDTITVAFRK